MSLLKWKPRVLCDAHTGKGVPKQTQDTSGHAFTACSGQHTSPRWLFCYIFCFPHSFFLFFAEYIFLVASKTQCMSLSTLQKNYKQLLGTANDFQPLRQNRPRRRYVKLLKEWRIWYQRVSCNQISCYKICLNMLMIMPKKFFHEFFSSGYHVCWSHYN